jgi:hypothetical protein
MEVGIAKHSTDSVRHHLRANKIDLSTESGIVLVQ